MNDMDDVFKKPERSNLSDRQFEMLLAARAKERAARTGLIAFLTCVGIFGAIITISILASNGAFNG